jgi:hypothetical protein
MFSFSCLKRGVIGLVEFVENSLALSTDIHFLDAETSSA